MKRLHLVLLLAGALAIGSAFTSTNVHRAPCDGLQIVHWNYQEGKPYPDDVDGDCLGDPKSCTYGKLITGGYVPCDDIMFEFVPNPTTLRK